MLKAGLMLNLLFTVILTVLFYFIFFKERIADELA